MSDTGRGSNGQGEDASVVPRKRGTSTSASFAKWAGISAFDSLELAPVATPLGEASILAADEALMREPAARSTAVRLLPSGDAYWLHHDAAHRELLVPDAKERAALWTPRVWPGALLVAGELAGAWRRAQGDLSVEPWRLLTKTERAAVEAEAASLPLPGLNAPVSVRWLRNTRCLTPGVAPDRVGAWP